MVRSVALTAKVHSIVGFVGSIPGLGLLDFYLMVNKKEFALKVRLFYPPPSRTP